ncbi:ABC transporter substrate-binding protein [Paenibacillus sp. 481]|uniref:ABC transporter substrate-binding protein n=1 Tax=Paenibacillus sp. 481 TaxID=2835869 RepID=UPI001E31EB25|nr:extracellular solute-binding protein [Paenibacillus sp. 481]UHA74545.1 extracellular solute-binding protein [Paenibacillus sp. 481]
MFTNKWKISIVLLIAISMLAGCFGEKPAVEELGEDGAGKIKILAHNEEMFYQQYGNYFNVKYPNIEFEIVSTSDLYSVDKGPDYDHEKEMKKLIDKHKPDVLTLGVDMLEHYASAGKLYNLEPLIQQEKYDLQKLLPGLIDMLRSKGDGILYGLTPTFGTQLLYYNEDLFTKHGIELPRNKMTWDEVLQLSARFANIGKGEHKVHGLFEARSSMYDFLVKLGTVEGLKMFDTKGETLLIQSDGWKNLIKKTTDAYRNQVISNSAPPEKGQSFRMMDGDLFFSGKAAMIIDQEYTMHRLENQSMYGGPDVKKMKWGFVTAPISASAPNDSPYISTREVYAIHNDSPNKRAAWEFVKFVNGLDMANANGRTNWNGFPTITGVLKDVDGKSVEPLYMLKPTAEKHSFYGNTKNVPSEYMSQFSMESEQMLKSIVDKKKNVDQAVAEFQQKMQQQLKKAIEEKKKKEQKK